MKARSVLIGLGLFAGLVVGTTLLVASLPSGQAFMGSNTGTYKTISWHELAPKGWDPYQQFRNVNRGLLIDSDPSVIQMMKDLRAEWDNAPTVSTLDKAKVKIPGYLVPIEEVSGEIKEFLLVPYFGACVHSPPPPANQIVHVTLSKGIKGFRTMDTVWVSGTMSTRRHQTDMGTSGYRLDAMLVEPYIAKNK